MRIAVFPGSFDPITLGHLDVITRASKLFDRVYICTMVTAWKTPMFTPEQRLELLRVSVEGLPNVTAELWTGLLADYAAQRGAHWLVKGARNGTDFDLEYGMAQINRGLDAQLETILLPASPQYLHVSSTMVREMIKYQRDLFDCMPEAAVRTMKGWNTDGEQ